MVTSYRAELSGIIATLYLVYRVCQYYCIMEGAMTLYCDNKGALKNALHPIKAGITPYFKTDHDLIEVAQALITLIPIVISSLWVKGHDTGKNKEYQHVLNQEADKLAGQYQDRQVPHHTNSKTPPTTNHKICLLYDSSVITSNIQSNLVDSLHSEPIVDQILQKTKWTRLIFQKVHWDAHECAFCRLPRYSQHSTAKMIHRLVNTNRQNHIYYGKPPLCPICNQEEETLRHVFSCPSLEAVQHHQNRLEDLKKTLTGISTPPPVIEAIAHGLVSWCQDPHCQHIRALTAGSLRGQMQFSPLHFMNNIGRSDGTIFVWGVLVDSGPWP